MSGAPRCSTTSAAGGPGGPEASATGGRTASDPSIGAPALEVRGLHVRMGGAAVLRGADLVLPAGSLTALLGPNGAGKTTLLRAAAGLVRAERGSVRIAGTDVAGLSRRAAARVAGYLPQEPEAGFPLTVHEAVRLGRYPHVGAWGAMGPADEAAVRLAMEQARCTHLAGRVMSELSGGERRRAAIARALAGGAPVLLLDEPLTALDIGGQLDVAALLAELAAGGRTVVASVHDLRLAAERFPRAALLHDGVIAAAGTPDELIASGQVGRAFGVQVMRSPDGGVRFERG